MTDQNQLCTQKIKQLNYIEKKEISQMKKFELTSEFITNIFGTKLFRIKALISFGKVEAGELGGYIEKEENLGQSGDAWVSGDAEVYGDADYAVVQGFGSCFRTTTFFRTKDKEVKVACGCFFGTIAEFKDKVKTTHGDSKYAKEYLAIVAAMEIHFDITTECAQCGQECVKEDALETPNGDICEECLEDK